MIKAVILAGGSGKRLWPISRSSHPKQFLNFFDDNSMLQNTVKRLDKLNIESFLTICNEEHRFFVANQLLEIDKLDDIILEPFGKNTAPAIALAALMSHEDDILLVLSADHVFQDNKKFIDSIKNAYSAAQNDKLVTFGIKPDQPNIEYGYLEKGEKYDQGYHVKNFHEKPKQDRANAYLESNNFLWNSGIFLFKAGVFLKELEKFRPIIKEKCKESINYLDKDGNFIRVNENIFAECPSESIDYAVMENTDKAVVFEINAGWSDIGSWSSLWNIKDKDKNGNVVNGDIILHNTKNCYVSTDGVLTTSVGVSDLIIVSTKDAFLVANKNNLDDIQLIPETLKSKSRDEYKFNREVHRPWGKFDSLDKKENYQVKKITVNPGSKLSLQKHFHRSEHWVVVKGTAKVTKGDKTFLLNENESTYIHTQEIHALENTTNEPLELIEVQTGSYLGEDDIVRYEDRYGRK
jgi:mannose-1-phosphate guanylyltransferase